MASTTEKLRLHIRGGGRWEKVNNVMEYVSDQVFQRGVMLRQNITHDALVSYVAKKFEIEGEFGLSYKYDGGVFLLGDDDDVIGFMELASTSRRPATLYISVETSVSRGFRSGRGSNVGGSSTPPPIIEAQPFVTHNQPSFIDEQQLIRQQEVPYVPQFVSQEEPNYGYNNDWFPDTEEFPEGANVFKLGIPEIDDTDSEDGDSSEEGALGDGGEPNEEICTANTSFSAINDFFGMPPIVPTPVPTITDNEPVNYNRTTHICLGQIFNTNEELKLAMGLKFVKEGFEFKVNRSGPKRYEAVCVHESCNWKIRANVVGESTMFEVRKLEDRHTCSGAQLHPNHRQANRKVLGHIIKKAVSDESRNYRPNDIRNDVNEQFHISVSYKQAWSAKCFALAQIRGTPSVSFSRLPVYFYNLERLNPGTVTRIRTDEMQRFRCCFVALGCAIRTFLNNLRPVIVIDGAHLKGEYLGTMFLAVGMDGNNQIVPIAYGVGRSESGDEWTWFLTMLKQCIGEVEGLVFISDRAASIKQAITTVYPGAHHGLCCRHLEMNVYTTDKRVRSKKKLFWKTVKAYTVEEFQAYMNQLQRCVPDGSAYMNRIGPARWSRVYFPGMRYNMMTSNSAESVNALSRFARKLPIVSLLEYFRGVQQQWYAERHDFAVQSQHALTPWAQKKIKKRMWKSATWTVHPMNNNMYEVRDGRRDGIVDLHARTCSCRKWQLSALPCGHAIAVAKQLQWRDCSQMASPYYTTINLRATYQESVIPVGPNSTWIVPAEYMTVHPPLKTKKVGRPSNHDRIPSRGEEPRQRNCSRCGGSGHNRRHCTMIIPPVQFPRSRASGSHSRNQASHPTQPTYSAEGLHQTEPGHSSQQDGYGNFMYPTFDLNE